MGTVHQFAITEPEFGDGDGDGGDIMFCPNCEAEEFRVYDTLYGECINCGQGVNFAEITDGEEEEG